MHSPSELTINNIPHMIKTIRANFASIDNNTTMVMSMQIGMKRDINSLTDICHLSIRDRARNDINKFSKIVIGMNVQQERPKGLQRLPRIIREFGVERHRGCFLELR